MLELLGFTGRRAGAPSCVLSREKGVATYFADSYLLIRITVLLLLRQGFAPLGLRVWRVIGIAAPESPHRKRIAISGDAMVLFDAHPLGLQIGAVEFLDHPEAASSGVMSIRP